MGGGADRVTALRLLWLYLRIGVMRELAYPANLAVQVVQSAASVVFALAGIAVVFSHTATLGGWNADDLLALVGVWVLVGGAVGLVIQPSMQQLMEDVRQGTLDYTLLQPEDSQTLVSVRQVQIYKVLDVAMGLGLLALALGRLGARVGWTQAAAFGLALGCGGAVVYSVWLVLATCAFWFVRVDNILVVFETMYEAGRWPVGIYPRWLRAALTFVVPVAFATTVPAEALTGRLTAGGVLTAMGVAAVLLMLSRVFWLTGVRHYSGASS